MKSIIAIMVTLVGTLLNQSTVAQSIPDLILTNGKIFTSDTGAFYAEAFAVKGDQVMAVGTTKEIEVLAGPKTRRINLGGRTVIPGINDAHDHLGYGAPVSYFIRFAAPMLEGPSRQMIFDSLTAVVKQLPYGMLIQGDLGLRIIEDKLSRRAMLDSIAPNHPVILNAPWGHGTLINTRAMNQLGIKELAPDPVGGTYERIPGSQRISGLLTEYAEFGVKRQWHGTLPQSVMVDVFKEYGENAIRMGITSVQNMATSLDLEKTVTVLKAADLPIRVRVIRFPGTSAKGRELAGWQKVYSASPKLQVGGMKWILDGTPLERGALMKKAYSDGEGYRGKLNFSLDTVRQIVREGAKSKEQLLLHIVGDSTPALVIREMLKVGKEAMWKEKRVRFEHADGLLGDQWANAKRLGIVAVVNPSHFMFAEVNHTRIGKSRMESYQPFRSLIEAGIPVAIGSDGPNNPFLNIMFAAIHPTNPKEAVTREQAVIAYTFGSAFAERKEKEKGRIAKGMLADFAVLSQDIFSVPLPELPKTQSVLTVVGGKIVYNSGALGK